MTFIKAYYILTKILAEGVNDDGFGVAIMNRMEKASGHHIIYK